MKNQLTIMNHTGDTAHQFDPENSAEVKEAMELFADHIYKGHIAAERTGSGTSKKVTEFNPNATETLLFPRLQGG